MPLTDTVRHVSLLFFSTITAFIIAMLLSQSFIQLLIKARLTKQLREKTADGKAATVFQKLHKKKLGTPTMGGVLIWGTTLIVILLSRFFSYLGLFKHSLINRKETYLPIFALLTTAVLGAIDDYLNVKGIGQSKGINIKPKFFWLIILSTLGALWFYYKLGFDHIHIPGLGDFTIGWWYVPLFVLVITATANAVNITDGLDGLAGGLLIIAYGVFAAIAYAKGLFILSSFCGIIIGATLGFLWFNIPPARFYMGDTGALSLGATLGVIALLTNSVLILPIIGFIFVIETLSVIIQLISKRFWHKKIFQIAPLHHHFEALGWPESQVTMRFWIIGGLVATIGLILGLIGMGI